jgi:hypothetical protein
LLGVTAFVTIYSMVIAHFRTVHLCFLLIAVFAFYEIKKRFPPVSTPNKREQSFKLKIIFELLFVALVLCGWEALFLLNNTSFPYVMPHFDHTDYSTISQFMNLTGEENAFRESNLYNNAFKGLIPYHYFELWLNAAIAKCSGLLYSTTLLLVVYPLFYFLFYLGINSIWEEYAEITFSKKLLSVFFLFFGAFCFPFYEKLPFVNQYFYGLVIKSFPAEFLAKKMICIYVFAIPAFLCMKRNYFSIGFLFLLSIVIVFAAAAPGIIIGSFVFLIISRFSKLIPLNEWKRTLLYLLLFSLFIFILYKVSGNKLLVTVEGNIFDQISTNSSGLKKQLSDVIWLCQTIPLQSVLAYLPFVIVIALLFSFNRGFAAARGLLPVTLLIIIITLCGFVAWMLLLPVTDSFQFYSSLVPLLNIGCIFILIKMFSSAHLINIKNHDKKAIVYFILISVLVLQVVFSFKEQYQRKQEKENIYSPGYIQEIEKIKGEIKNPVGVCLYNSDTRILAPYRIQAGLYLKFIPGFENTVNISLLDKEFENPREKHHLKSSFFYFYVMKQKESGAFKNISQTQVDFIMEFKIDYIVAQKNFVSPAILEREKKVITDPESGEKFILLNDASGN